MRRETARIHDIPADKGDGFERPWDANEIEFSTNLGPRSTRIVSLCSMKDFNGVTGLSWNARRFSTRIRIEEHICPGGRTE
jgi:hypothetical protein